MFSKEKASSLITDFITNSFLFGNTGIDVATCDSFLESGIIDSTGILELIEFLQSKFTIKIEDTEMLPENLDSLNNILSFISTKGSIEK